MTEAGQAALYRAGFKDFKSGYMGKVDWDSRYADALEDHMTLEVLFSDEELDARRKAYKERGALLMRGADDRSYFPNFSTEATVQGYAAMDAEITLAFLGRWNKAKRLAAQRPLIHNGRKMKR